MPWDFKACEALVQDTLAKTQSREILWQEANGGFIERDGFRDRTLFFLFGEFPPRLIYRALAEDFDLVVSQESSPDHSRSLQTLNAYIIRQLGLLF